MIDEQKLREVAGAAVAGDDIAYDILCEDLGSGVVILALLDELQSLRSERTAWRVTAENAEKDAARWKHIEYMHGRGIPMETIAHYIARPERLDYSAELHKEHAMKETP